MEEDQTPPELMEVDSSEGMLINEEYKVWKKHSPLLYDQIITHALEWPSLTMQWLPDTERQPEQAFTTHRAILGTHTSDKEPNHLMIAEIKIPDETAIMPSQSPNGSRDGEHGGFGHANALGMGVLVNIVQRINHTGEVNRARYMWQNPNVIATKSASADVLVFDRTLHPSKPSKDGICSPDLVLKGHSREGFGLSWSKFKEGYLLSGSNDNLVCLWDINSAVSASGGPPSKSLLPLRTFTGHSDVVEDVCWSPKDENIFASCGDDSKALLWDTRNDSNSEASIVLVGHVGEVNSVDFNPFNANLVATAGSDKSVIIWDIRRPESSLHALNAHNDQIYRVEWSPFSEAVLASAGQDRRVMVWDLSLVGAAQSEEDALDGPPELLFVHGGHTDKVSDFSWNPSPSHEWMIGSVAENNVLQVWKMSEHIYAGDE